MTALATTGFPRRIHAVGIGGGGLGPLARMLAALGHDVSGSDGGRGFDPGPYAAVGLAVHAGHAADHVDGAELVVHSAAVPPDNPELVAAHARRVPVRKYAEALGDLSRRRPTIAVAGTHGKTTTSALVAHLLEQVGVEPGWIVGGVPATLPSAARWGRDDAPFVVEACEYDLSFLNLAPRWATVTGVVPDHLDCFGDARGVTDAFARFVATLPADGGAVFGRDVPDEVAERAACRVLRLGADVACDDVLEDADGHRGTLRVGDERAPFRFTPIGVHNVDHLGLAAGLAHFAAPQVPLAELATAAATFRAPGRRLEDLGDVDLGDGRVVRLVDDFAHHPDALAAARTGLARRFAGRRQLAVFEPHQVSRTADFLDDFARELSRFDRALLCDVFVTRDRQPERAEDLAAALAAAAGEACTRCGPSTSTAAVDAILEHAEHDDVVVVMGAGSIDGLARRIARHAARP